MQLTIFIKRTNNFTRRECFDYTTFVVQSFENSQIIDVILFYMNLYNCVYFSIPLRNPKFFKNIFEFCVSKHNKCVKGIVKGKM